MVEPLPVIVWPAAPLNRMTLPAAWLVTPWFWMLSPVVMTCPRVSVLATYQPWLRQPFAAH